MLSFFLKEKKKEEKKKKRKQKTSLSFGNLHSSEAFFAQYHNEIQGQDSQIQ